MFLRSVSPECGKRKEKFLKKGKNGVNYNFWETIVLSEYLASV